MEKIFRNKEKGLSLIEVLLALTLLSGLVLYLGTMTKSTMIKQQKIKTQNEITYELNRILEQISYDLAHAYIISTKDLARNGGHQKPSTLFAIEKARPSDALKMTYSGHKADKANSHESDFSYVVYRVKEDPDNKESRNLYRGEHPRVPEDFKSDPPMKIFAKGVHSIKLTAWDGQRWSKEKWDSTMRETKNKLPKMVRVEVFLWKRDPKKMTKAEKDSELERFVTIVYLNQSLDLAEVKTPSKRFRIL